MIDKLNNKINLEETKNETSFFKGKLINLKDRLFKNPFQKKKREGWVKEKKPLTRKRKILLFVFFGLLVAFLIFIPLLVVRPLLKLKNDGETLAHEVEGIYTAFQSQDLTGAVAKIKTSNEALAQLSADYRLLVWAKPFPYFGNFYKDGEHLLAGGGYLLEAADVAAKALEPYADLLGLEEGEEEKEVEKMTTEERLFLALDTLDKLQPSLDEIGGKLKLAREEVDQIDPSRYPEQIRGIKVRSQVVDLIKTIDETAQLATEIKPVVGFLKQLMGVPDKINYLLLFQNDAELRPTGGFLTAYALLSVDNGKVTPGASFDIYTLDARFGNRVAAPEPIKKYLPGVYYWHLRDMNLSPDFTVSMETFWENAQKVVGYGEIDGIIALDTNVLVDLLEVLGPIGVAGWGNFSAENDPRCDCPQVFYELELFADKPVTGFREERKGIIGPLMHSILLNVMGSPRKTWPEYFNLVFENIREKHLLFYFFDDEIQEAMEALNASGRVRDFQGDFFYLNDCNFAGAKSNMFIQQEVVQEIEVGKDGTLTKKVTVDYKNPAPPSNCNLEKGELCLNGLYRDWYRLYVPLGSELLDSSGSEVEVKTYEEFGKTVFEGFYGEKSPLRPEGKTQISFQYKLPFKVNPGETYRLLIQKQPGAKNHDYQIQINGKQQQFELSADKEIQLGL